MFGTMDLAVLGLEVRSDGVVVASQRLEGLDRSAQNTTRATDRFRQELTQTNTTAQTATKSIQNLSKVLGVLGAAMSAAFAFKVLSDFEQSMASVRAVTRSTGMEFDSLREKAKQLGASTRFTASDAAEAMRFLGQAGFQANEILTASGDVLALAQAGSLGLADAAEISAKALRGFRLDVSQMNEVADLMAKAFTSSNTTVGELGEAFTYVGPVATSFKISIQDTTAAISALSDSGISASMAGTSLRGILTKLANPTKQAEAILLKYVDSLTELDVKSRGLIPVLETLAKSGMGVEDAMAVFGQRAGPGFEVLGASIEKMKEFQKQFQGIGGYAKETAAIMDDNLQGALLNFVSAMEDMIIGAAESSGILEGMKNGLFLLADVLRAMTQNAIVPWLDNAVVALGLYIAATKGAALYTSATSGAIAYQITLFKMYVASTAGAATATNALTVAFSALRGVMVALAANPLFWIVAAGSALYILYDAVQENERKMEDLRKAFQSTGEEAEYVTEKAKEAAAALQEMQKQTQLTEAQDKLKDATATLDSLLSSFERSTGVMEASRSAGASYARQIGSISEAFWGLEKGTWAAASAVGKMSSELQKTTDAAQRAKVINETLKELRELERLHPDLESIQTAIKDVQALAGALKLVIDAEDGLAKVNAGIEQTADTATQARREIEELEAALELINKKPVVPQTAAEAIQFLEDLTQGTDAYKQKQYEAQMATAAASLEILKQAQTLAIAEGRFEDANAILAKYVELQSMVAQVEPPKPKRGGSGGEDKVAKFRQSALDKIKELELKILETQYAINGASEKELAITKLKIEQQKELEDLRRRAAEAGQLGSEELRKAQELTNQLYELKIQVAEFEAAWDPVLREQQHAIDRMNALGVSTDKATIKMKEMQIAMLQSTDNPSFGTEETLRQIELLNAEIIKMRDNLYGTFNTEKLDLVIQVDNLNEAMNEGIITAEQYGLRMMDIGLRLAEINQMMGESTFHEDVSLALAGIVEGYEGVTAGLTQSFNGFFTSFTQGFANSIGQAIVYGDDLKESLNQVAKQAIAGLISSLIQLGIQWAVSAALQQTLAATTMAASTAMAAATGTALAAAYAPAAAMASLASFGANAAPAMAGISATNALAQALALSPFKEGGYTGNMGVDDVAGVVHGQEYVMDAATTSKYGVGAFDALRDGSATIASTGEGAYAGMGTAVATGDVNVTIENYGTSKDFDVERVSRDEVRVIARDVAEEVVDERAPKTVASDIRNPNGTVSKALNQNTRVQRRHGG